MNARTLVATIVLLMAVTGSAASAEEAAVRVAFNIQEQPIGRALTDLGEQAGLQVLVRTEDMKSGRSTSPAVSGKLSVAEALERVLANSGLTYQFLGERTVRVLTIAAEDTRGVRNAPAISSKGADLPLVLAQRRPRGTEEVAALQAAERTEERAKGGKGIAEVVVTAQKREERLQDVPVPVTAIDAASLIENNQLRLQDYYTQVPGLNVMYDGTRGGLPSVAIRGLRTSASENPAVGVVVDDVPYGSSLRIVGGTYAPDLDPGDLRRVEVLRGPQGALYGASSMGGLLKFVTMDPSAAAGFSGRAQIGASGVTGGDGVGYSARAGANIPLSDTLAVRASGFTRRDPGYIDDATLGLHGVNELDVRGGRVSALWSPTEALSVKLSALIQDSEMGGSQHVFPALGDLQQAALRGTGWIDNMFEVYDATIRVGLGRAELTSISGYSINERSNSIDASAFFGNAARTRFGVSGAAINEDFENKKVTQEIRVSTPISKTLDWLVGGFYADEDSRADQPRYAVDPVTGNTVGSLATSLITATFREYAAFTNLTWKPTERFDVQFGGRYSENRYGEQRQPVALRQHSEDDVFTYLLAPKFQINENLMAYARFSSGYRAGGANLSSVPLSSGPIEYRSDTTRNYEVGLKGDLLDQRLSVDVSLYTIDWNDIQLALVDLSTGQGFIDNGGEARSRGVEFSLESSPLAGMDIAGSIVWSDADLSEDFPLTSSVRGFSGDRLPFNADWSGNLSLTQQFPLSSRLSGVVGAALSYVGSRQGLFTGPAMSSPLPSSPRQSYASYTRADLRVGLRYESWSLDMFINNVADRRAVLSGGFGTLFPAAFTVIQPRNFGMSLAAQF